MFARFKYNLHDYEYDSSEYLDEGEDIYLLQRCKIKGIFNSYIRSDRSIDAAKIEEDWFPTIDAQVFLSHSHADEDQVKAFAGWLKKKFGITCFIDSSVWGYANDLLKEMDNMYSRDRNNNLSYELVHQSSSHIHMLLQGALAKMLNNCECLIFVNSPNSMKPTDIKDENLTGSPWIYSEILMADTFPPRALEEHRLQSIQESVHRFSVDMSYPLDLKAFRVIEKTDFILASSRVDSYIGGLEQSKRKSELILEQLYIDKGLLKKRTTK